MKNILITLLLSTVAAFGQSQLIDQTTPHTNTLMNNGQLWVSGEITNKAYTAVQSNVVSRGDSASNAWSKANANFALHDFLIASNAAWIATNTALLNTPYVAIFTSLHTSDSNYIGSVSNFYAFTLTQVTNYDPLYLFQQAAVLDGTNGYLAPDGFPTNWVVVTNSTISGTNWLALATSNTLAISGQPAGLTVDSVLAYTNYTTSPTTVGLFTNVTSWSLDQTTNFSPMQLFGSYSSTSTNWWVVADTFQSSLPVYLALAGTNAGGFTSLTVYSLDHPERNGTNHFTGQTFVMHRSISDEYVGNSISYPSNTWDLAAITNGMNDRDIKTVNSNGLTLVDVFMSNGTPVLKSHW